ncbi:hypothetical protein HD598_002154 [Neomicrococcus aestuarii]|uniref:Uncharacterized protein n=1 Tax=Neomicrococcus aestuarii TaxID=556325 RepID=A0A7W8TV37_9MICC|nr:hypothetical protein [Neomicrococcus aestuarii]MBB5513467.1 hypothetical protein [Neomicrococcus aestuarii]
MGIFSDRPTDNFGTLLLYKNGDIEDLSKPKGERRQSLIGAEIELEDGAALSKRVTASRVLLTGVFALALKKKSGGESWLSVTSPDFSWLLEVDRKDAAKATKFVQACKQRQRELLLNA